MDHKEHKEKKEKKEPKKDKKEGKKEKKGGFQIKYKIKPCPPKGDGVVAKERIPKGTLVWTGVSAQHRLNEEQVRARLAEMKDDDERKFFLNHVYCYGGFCNELQDDSKFTNHSRRPNMGTSSKLKELGVVVLPLPGDREPNDDTDCFASRDIEEGEEITDDYGEYQNPEYYVSLCKQYNVEWAGRVAELYE